MNPTAQPGQNPFAGIMAKIAARKAQEQQTAQASAQPAPAPTSGAQGADAPPDQLQRGDSGGNSQFLVSALQSLQKYITDEVDPQNISIGRGLIALVTKLIAKEQQTLAAKLPQTDTATGQDTPQQDSSQTPPDMGGMMGSGQDSPMGQ